jgi:hypothetical protein
LRVWGAEKPVRGFREMTGSTSGREMLMGSGESDVRGGSTSSYETSSYEKF